VRALGFAHSEPESNQTLRSDGLRSTRSAHLTLGAESVDLHSPEDWRTNRADDAAISVASTGFQHLAIVSSDMDESMRRLRQFAPSPITQGDPVRLPESSGGVVAFKFRDPDGNPLELIEFPARVGDPRWHRQDIPGPNLGFDHSAISVFDVERSLEFYVGGLGFSIASRHVNHGDEQAQLDGCAESIVEVVGLAPIDARTPHLELLGYRAPVPRLPSVLPVPMSDRYDRMTFIVSDLMAVVERLRALRPDLGNRLAESQRGEIEIRDDDGHLMLLVQATQDGQWPTHATGRAIR
jgi:catechol 2,3-dioxygenase-like lactoylglutathione lyase family enzyme